MPDAHACWDKCYDSPENRNENTYDDDIDGDDGHSNATGMNTNLHSIMMMLIHAIMISTHDTANNTHTPSVGYVEPLGGATMMLDVVSPVPPIQWGGEKNTATLTRPL